MTKSMTKAQRMVLREALADGGSWWPCGIAWFGRCARGMERLGLVSIIEAGGGRRVRGVKLTELGWAAAEEIRDNKPEKGDENS